MAYAKKRRVRRRSTGGAKIRNFYRPGLIKALGLVREVTSQMTRRHQSGSTKTVSKGKLADMQAATLFVSQFGSASDKAAARSALRRAELALMTANRRRGSHRRSTRNGSRLWSVKAKHKSGKAGYAIGGVTKAKAESWRAELKSRGYRVTVEPFSTTGSPKRATSKRTRRSSKPKRRVSIKSRRTSRRRR